jgi:hypothetical protein
MTACSVKDNLGQPVTDPFGRLPDRDSLAGEISVRRRDFRRWQPSRLRV